MTRGATEPPKRDAARDPARDPAHDPARIDELEAGDHLFIPFTREEELARTMAATATVATRRGDRCLLSLEEESWSATRSLLDPVLDVAALLESGSLRACTDRGRFLGRGGFDANLFAELLREEAGRCAPDETLWLANDMGWVVGEGEPAAASREVELWARREIGDLGLTALCCYRRSDFPEPAMERALELHSLAFLEDIVFPNPFHRPRSPEGGEAGGSRLTGMMRRLERAGTEARRLRRSERALQTLLRNIPDVVVRLDPDLRFLYANRTAARVVGIPAEEMVGRTHAELGLDPGPGDRWLSAARETLRDSRAREVEGSFTLPDGTLRWFQSRVIPEGEAGEEPESVLVIGQDVTREVELRQEVVEISARERRRIGRDLHDDLGQHLTGLAFLAREVEGRLADADRPEARDLAELERLLNQAVVKTRQVALDVQPPTLREGLEGALESLARESEATLGVSVTLEVEDGAASTSMAEATHLYRMAQEATTNAVRHGGADHLRIRWRASDAGRRLEIRDDGRGFDPATVEPGLGLRIMRYRARVIGGTLELRSAPGEGTTVACVLPAEAGGG